MSAGDTLSFSALHITDQKRLVRGEHFLLARTMLRARDERHHANWRILTLAGGAPRGEMMAIRELMPKAYVLAVDKDQRCLESAIDAGADDVVECDVLAYEYIAAGPGRSSSYLPPRELRDRAKFDIVNLDLCGPVTRALARGVSIFMSKLITTNGLLMVTFSYGRDVAEMYQGLGRSWLVMTSQVTRDVETFTLPSEVSDSVAGRIMYLGQQKRLRSIMVYRGAEMPMCSLLFQCGHAVNRSSISFAKVEHEDFELATVYPDSANLYDCPQDRIESLRRRHAALKAALTRSRKASPSPLQFEPQNMTKV